jgi:hypothetical protein
MVRVFSIDGYWKDDREEFQGYLVTNYHDTPEGWKEEDFFFFGVEEGDLKEMLNSEETVHDFVVTSYQEMKLYS